MLALVLVRLFVVFNTNVNCILYIKNCPSVCVQFDEDHPFYTYDLKVCLILLHFLIASFSSCINWSFTRGFISTEVPVRAFFFSNKWIWNLCTVWKTHLMNLLAMLFLQLLGECILCMISSSQKCVHFLQVPALMGISL